MHSLIGKTHQSGFSLAEVMIALGIIATIAVFAIPKFRSTADTKVSKQRAQSAVAEVISAYMKYKQEKNVTNSFNIVELKDYLNYVSEDTVTKLDAPYNSAAGYLCSAPSRTCLKMNNGGTLTLFTSFMVGQTENHMVIFAFDPDSKFSGNVGASRAIEFFLYYDGSVRSWGTAKNPSIYSSGSTIPQPLLDPEWWDWS